VARGLVSAMTDRVCFAYTAAFLQHLTNIGQFAPGTAVAIAGGLRPSSPRIMAACAAAVWHMGGTVDDCGFVPSPAVAAHGFAKTIPSLMVTGIRDEVHRPHLVRGQRRRLDTSKNRVILASSVRTEHAGLTKYGF
jgi:hypothetical protein